MKHATFKANNSARREVAALIERHGMRKVLEAVAEYCAASTAIFVWAPMFTTAAAQLPPRKPRKQAA
jgi:hypothetical protein